MTLDDFNEFMTVVRWMQYFAFKERMMNNQPSARDTQFLGFATLLLAEFTNTDGYDLHEVEKLVARRAYDLIAHSLDFAFTKNIVFGTPEEATEQIPDLTTWPESEAKE